MWPIQNLREIRCRFLNQLHVVKADEISALVLGGWALWKYRGSPRGSPILSLEFEEPFAQQERNASLIMPCLLDRLYQGGEKAESLNLLKGN